MNFKKGLVCVIFMLALLPATVYAQTSLYKLPSDKRAIGLGYAGTEGIHNIWVSVDRGFTETVKGSAVTNLSIFESNSSILLISELLQLVHIDALGTTGLDYFLMGGFGGTYLVNSNTSYGYDPYRTSYSYYGYNRRPFANSGLESLTLAVGGGLSITFEQLKPFVGYTYNYIHILNGGRSNASLLTAGVEIDLGGSISLIGRMSSGYTADGLTNPTFDIGVNFH